MGLEKGRIEMRPFSNPISNKQMLGGSLLPSRTCNQKKHVPGIIHFRRL
jgi:hypothetical protein